jgi:hypothetical protein
MGDDSTRERQDDLGDNADQAGAPEPRDHEGSAAPTPAARPPKEQQSPTGVPWTKPGHIAEPRERGWGAEPADPYEGISREDPFEGRPRSDVPQPDEPSEETQDLGPGQPRRKR